ncbi:unnamed protein product [Soboliphyme baturini]|uniref:tRNA(Phe) (4-demethylwyosine(37)-C(7)) aminocarboxypropyltransferase n=1 Tax=Soboliphyme baturini TaxID=241478 RepID=A0A183IUB8_9BILA|nr:unnamed protein product [Soboliphyme baturini]
MELWKTVARCLQVDRLARRRRVASDAFRSSLTELLLGENGWVEQVDNHIRYRYDVTKCMFSSGNITEKLRISKMNCAGEVVADMFAGIGYFVLPYLVHAQAALVHACEWNASAIEALRLNLALNKVQDKCIIHEGDCREVCPAQIADRVNMGILPSSKAYLPTACRALKPRGGFIHIHENVTSSRLKKEGQSHMSLADSSKLKNNVERDAVLSEMEDGSSLLLMKDFFVKWNNIDSNWRKFATDCGNSVLRCLKVNYNGPWNVAIVSLYRVKSYAPRIDHLVLDLKCFPVQDFSFPVMNQ